MLIIDTFRPIELLYADVYKVWEAIWSARHIVTDNFVVFVALAMVRYYRDIIIENNMDFTDTIKFFNGEYTLIDHLAIFFWLIGLTLILSTQN